MYSFSCFTTRRSIPHSPVPSHLLQVQNKKHNSIRAHTNETESVCSDNIFNPSTDFIHRLRSFNTLDVVTSSGYSGVGSQKEATKKHTAKATAKQIIKLAIIGLKMWSSETSCEKAAKGLLNNKPVTMKMLFASNPGWRKGKKKERESQVGVKEEESSCLKPEGN